MALFTAEELEQLRIDEAQDNTPGRKRKNKGISRTPEVSKIANNHEYATKLYYNMLRLNKTTAEMDEIIHHVKMLIRLNNRLKNPAEAGQG